MDTPHRGEGGSLLTTTTSSSRRASQTRRQHPGAAFLSDAAAIELVEPRACYTPAGQPTQRDDEEMGAKKKKCQSLPGARGHTTSPPAAALSSLSSLLSAFQQQAPRGEPSSTKRWGPVRRTRSLCLGCWLTGRSHARGWIQTTSTHWVKPLKSDESSLGWLTGPLRKQIGCLCFGYLLCPTPTPPALTPKPNQQQARCRGGQHHDRGP